MPVALCIDVFAIWCLAVEIYKFRTLRIIFGSY